MDDLVDIILENEKYKEKLLLTNVKKVKNTQYYTKVVEEMKDRCKERDEEYIFNVPQTRQKFKRCVNVYRNAVMTVKTFKTCPEMFYQLYTIHDSSIQFMIWWARG